MPDWLRLDVGGGLAVIFTITVSDDRVYLYVDKALVWEGSMERWSFALANAYVANTLVAA